MDFKPYFSEWAGEVDKFLTSYLRRRAKEAGKLAPIAGDLISDFAKFLVGGKRLRAGLVKLGYEIFGGKNPQDILPIAAAAEILHGALLIHDDIIDNSFIRHHQPTLHKKYEMIQRKRKKDNSSHYGESMGIVAGDIGLFETNRLILASSFSSQIKEKILKELTNIAISTGFGEAQDIELPQMGRFSQKEILQIHYLKTALYTFIGPLKYGALASGKAGKTKLKAIGDYALSVGTAFQLHDDILGMFGDEKTLGKPVDSDIKEGKNTLLYLETLNRSTNNQNKFLKKLWGNHNITNKEIDQIRGMVKESGALDHSVKMAQELVNKGKGVIPKLTKDPTYQEILATLADYIIEREK